MRLVHGPRVADVRPQVLLAVRTGAGVEAAFLRASNVDAAEKVGQPLVKRTPTVGSKAPAAFWVRSQLSQLC